MSTSVANADNHLQLENAIQKMNVDPEDTWLAIGAGISITLFGICVCLTMYKRLRPAMKESRSDGDLANMLEQGEST